MSEQTTDNRPGSLKARLAAKRSVLIAVGLTVGAALWIASGAMDAPEAEPAGPQGSAPAEPIAVRVAEIAARDHPRRIIVTGMTEVISAADIRAETAGQVAAKPVAKGATVDKGTVLVELRMDDRQAKLREAEALVKSTRLVFEASKNLQKKQFESEVKLADSEANLASAEAALEAIRLDIARTRVRAPIEGYVEKLEKDPGDYVAVGDLVATVIDLDPLRVAVGVAERDIADVHVDDLASVRLPGGREVGGTAQFVSRLADDKTRTFRVEIRIDNPDGSIPAGQTAEVELMGRSRPAHIVPPSALTLNDEGRLGVRIVDAEDKVRFKPVSIAEDTPDGAWVLGLDGMARVIVVGQEFVTEGEHVKPVAAGTPGAGT